MTCKIATANTRKMRLGVIVILPHRHEVMNDMFAPLFFAMKQSVFGEFNPFVFEKTNRAASKFGLTVLAATLFKPNFSPRRGVNCEKII